MTLQAVLACPHGAVPLALENGAPFRAWRLAQVEAQHRLGAQTGCGCGWDALTVRWGPAPGPRRRQGAARR